jgi:transcriptional regulator with XRE-family HTH domain
MHHAALAPYREDAETTRVGMSASQEDNEAMATAAVERLKRKLPDRIAIVRGDRSQRQFARDLGVFQQNVNRYESGTTPHTDFLITLALKEQISVDWLLLGKGKMRRSR